VKKVPLSGVTYSPKLIKKAANLKTSLWQNKTKQKAKDDNQCEAGNSLAMELKVCSPKDSNSLTLPKRCHLAIYVQRSEVPCTKCPADFPA